MTNLIILALLVSLPLRAQASAFISGNHGLDIEQSFDTSSIGTGAPNTMLQLPLQEIVPLDIAVVNSCIIDLGSIVDGSITPEIINNAIGGIDTILANPEGFRATVSKDQYNRLLSSLEKMNEQNYNVDMLNKIYSDIGDTLKRLRNKAIDLQDQLLNSFEDFKVAESSLEDTSEEDIITATNEDLELFAVADEKERIAILRRMEDRMEDCYDDSAINRTILMGLKAGLIGEISILEERGIVINVTTAAAGADLTAQETLAVIKGVIDYYEEKDNSSSIVVASNTDSQVEVESSYDALAGSNMEERALGADGLTATVFGVQVQGIIAGEVDLENLDNNVVVALQEGWGLIGEAARAAITDEAAVFSTDRTMVVYEDSGQIEIDNINNGVEFFGLMGGAPAQYAVIGTNDLSSLDSQNQELALLVEAGQVPIEFVGVIKGNTENYDIPDSHYALFGNYNNNGIDSGDLGVGDLGIIGTLGSVSTRDYIQPELVSNESTQPAVIGIDGPLSSISLKEEDNTTVFQNPTFANYLVWVSLVVAENPEIGNIDSQNQELALLVEAGQVPIEFVGVIKGNTENYDIPDSHYALFGNLNFFDVYSTLNIQNSISNFINFLLGDVKESTRLINTELDVDNKITFDSPGAIIKDILEKLNPKKTEEAAKLRLAMPKKIRLSHFIMLFFSLLIFSCSLGYAAGMYHIKFSKVQEYK